MTRKDDNPRPPSPDAAEETPSLSGAGRRAPSRDETPPTSPRTTPPPPPNDSSPARAAAARHPTSAALSDPRLGDTLVGRYRLDRLVGKGGMGRVYKATQFPLNRPVAVKILNPEFQKKDPQFVRRFFLEAASAARLSHPNTITVFDYGEAESGELFIAMEFLQGRPLSRVISAEGPFAAERVLHVGMQICRALREAHTKGIIHRDLKPGNILLLSEGDDADFVKVLDFGLVKLFNADGEPMQEDPLTPEPGGELTKAGMFLGSPKYMSPEQIQGVPPDPRTDIYSLGVLMFHMAAARAPFLGGSSVEVIYKHVNEAPPSFASLGIDIHPEAEALILRCLAKHRDDRFASMNELLGRMKEVQRDLTGFMGGTETGIEVDLSDLSMSGPRPRVQDSQDLSIPPFASQRPQTHPAPPGRATPSAGPRERPFVDTGPLDETGSGVLLKGRTTAAATRLAPWAAGLAFVVLLGVFAYVMVEPGAEPPSSTAATGVVDEAFEPAPAPEVKRVRVRFESTPAGADVFSPAGLAIGKTPFTASLAPTPEGEGPGAYLFKLDGREQTRRVRVEGETMAVRVTFEAGEAAPAAEPGPGPAPEPEPEDGDYKANPY